MTVTSTQLALGILGSGAFSAVLTIGLTWLKDLLTEKSKKDEEKTEKLYNPLRFYLMLMQVNTDTKTELTQSRVENEKNLGANREVENEIWAKFQEDSKQLTNDWWAYARKVMYLFQESPQYIKKEHWPLVEKLFRSHIFRKMVSGEETYKDRSYVYDTKTLIKDDANQFIETLKELYDEIKKS